MVRKNPFENVVGIDGSWWKYDNHFYNILTKKFPEAKKIQSLGDGQTTDFNVEYFIALKPDVVFMSAYNANSAKIKTMVKTLNQFNIPVVFVSSMNHIYIGNMQSLTIMGKIFDREKHISELNEFVMQTLNTVFSRIGRIQTTGTRPKVILELSGGYSTQCCHIAGRDGFGQIIADAGGDNWGANSLPNGGTMNVEQIYVSEFDKVLVTGGAWSQAKPDKVGQFLDLGYQAKKESIRKAFDSLSNRKHWKELKSIQNGELYGVWHQFHSTPYTFLATVAMAKWFYPDKFSDIDVQKIYDEFHNRFMPFEMTGYLSISMENANK